MTEKQRRVALKAVGFVALGLLVIGVLVIVASFLFLLDFSVNGFRSGPWSD